MFARIMSRLRSGRLRDREVRKLVRKLPVLLPPEARTDDKLQRLAQMIHGHSIMVRGQRLHARYLNGKMSYERWVKCHRQLGDRCVVVKDHLGNHFHVDRRVVSRSTDRAGTATRD